jgi:hypothetical protein
MSSTTDDDGSRLPLRDFWQLKLCRPTRTAPLRPAEGGMNELNMDGRE